MLRGITNTLTSLILTIYLTESTSGQGYRRQGYLRNGNQFAHYFVDNPSSAEEDNLPPPPPGTRYVYMSNRYGYLPHGEEAHSYGYMRRGKSIQCRNGRCIYESRDESVPNLGSGYVYLNRHETIDGLVSPYVYLDDANMPCRAGRCRYVNRGEDYRCRGGRCRYANRDEDFKDSRYGYISHDEDVQTPSYFPEYLNHDPNAHGQHYSDLDVSDFSNSYGISSEGEDDDGKLNLSNYPGDKNPDPIDYNLNEYK